MKFITFHLFFFKLCLQEDGHFNDNACFRAERLGLFMREALTAVTISISVRICYCRSGFFFDAEPISSKSVIQILIALADGTESWRLIKMKTKFTLCGYLTVIIFVKRFYQMSTLFTTPLFHVYWIIMLTNNIW